MRITSALVGLLVLAMAGPTAVLAQGRGGSGRAGSGDRGPAQTIERTQREQAERQRVEQEERVRTEQAERQRVEQEERERAGEPPEHAAAPEETGGFLGSLRRFFGWGRSQERMSEEGAEHERASEQERGPGDDD